MSKLSWPNASDSVAENISWRDIPDAFLDTYTTLLRRASRSVVGAKDADAIVRDLCRSLADLFGGDVDVVEVRDGTADIGGADRSPDADRSLDEGPLSETVYIQPIGPSSVHVDRSPGPDQRSEVSQRSGIGESSGVAEEALVLDIERSVDTWTDAEIRATLQAASHVVSAARSRVPRETSQGSGTPFISGDEASSLQFPLLGPSTRPSYVDDLSDCVLISTTDGIVRYANPGAARLCDLADAQDAIGIPLATYIAPDTDPGKIRRRMNQVYEKREATPVTEYQMVTETGLRRTVRVRSVPVHFNGAPAAQTTVRDVTRQRQIEQQLWETEERIRRLIENTQPIVFITDQKGRILVFEGKDLAATSYRTEDLVGHSVDERMGEKSFFAKAVRKALQGESVNEVMEIGGGVFDVWIAPIMDEASPSGGCIGMAADISDRIEVETSLREERDLLERIFETSPVAITVLDVHGNITRANDRAEEVLGLTPNNIESRAYNDPIWRHTTVEGKPLPDESQPFVIVMKTGKPVYDVRHAIEWPDGRRRILSISGTPLRDTAGQITGSMFVVENVTAEYERQRTSMRRQEKVRALYEAMSQLITLDTPEEVARRMLRLISETMGYRTCAVRLRKGNALIPACVTEDVRRYTDSARPDYSLDGSSIVAHAYRSGTTLAMDDVREANDGFDRGDIRSATYIPIGKYGIITLGSTTSGGHNAFDIQVIEILARNAETVLSRLENEEELRTARDLAEEASRLKSAMLANMSHEVRTPLTSIFGFADVIANETEEPQTEAFADRVRASSLRLRDTLDSVLHFSRLEADAVTPEMQPVNLVAEAKEIAGELDRIAQDSDVTLRVLASSPDITCHTDCFAVQRILRNLARNAIKFTPAGGSVEIQLTRGKQGAMLEVSDTGIGMSEAFQARMFNAFTQESDGIRREHEGSGLGLAIVQKLVDLIGGMIEVESTRGHGTRIAVFLPAAYVG